MTQRIQVRRAVTGRALVLGVLVILLIVLLASPLHRFFASRSAAADAANKLHSDKAQVTQLQQQLQQWSDPGYVVQQARQQLQYAMPGDTVYVVVNNGAKSDIQKTDPSLDAASNGAWNTKLWSSVSKAAK